MTKASLACSVACVIALTVGFGPDFSPTEQFIPIGQSPGVSGKLSVLGVVTKVEVMFGTRRFLCFDGQCYPAVGNEVIYLDRSSLKQSNLVGTWAEVQPGRTVEFYPNHWIKILVEEKR